MKLILDNQTLEKYNQYYFSEHPRAHVIPIPNPYHPSINQWFILKRFEMNELKQKWKNFIVWWMEDLGYKDAQLQQVKMTFTIYFPNRIRHDVDNQVPKFILDGFVEAGLVPDDDEKHITSLTLCTGYDKENPRTEILIEEI